MTDIRILVVEDDAEKLRRILECLGAIKGLNVDLVENARDCLSAKKVLREQAFDLLILDIALPEAPDQLPTPDGGIKLLEEILDRDLYHRPREVVGLTAFPDVRDRAGPRFAEDLWQVIQYDATSSGWVEQLQRKVRHIRLASTSNTRNSQYESYLCVLTALAEPELGAILNLPWNWSPVNEAVDGTVYYKGSFSKGGGSVEVVAACAPRMGMSAAAVLSMKMIQAFRPRYLAITGIAAGIRSECELGDIIFADPVWDWGSGKLMEKDGISEFYQAPHQIGISSFIRGKAIQMSADAEILDSIRREWKASKPTSALRMHVRPLASGAAVLADKTLVEDIKKQHRKLTGIDMETYGVYSAAEEAAIPQPRAFAIKSVSDFADAKKNDDFQAYAAFTSAMGLRLFVERFL